MMAKENSKMDMVIRLFLPENFCLIRAYPYISTGDKLKILAK